MLLFLSASVGIWAVRWRLWKAVSARRLRLAASGPPALKRIVGLPVVETVMPCPFRAVSASKWNGEISGGLMPSEMKSPLLFHEADRFSPVSMPELPNCCPDETGDCRLRRTSFRVNRSCRKSRWMVLFSIMMRFTEALRFGLSIRSWMFQTPFSSRVRASSAPETTHFSTCI